MRPSKLDHVSAHMFVDDSVVMSCSISDLMFYSCVGNKLRN